MQNSLGVKSSRGPGESEKEKDWGMRGSTTCPVVFASFVSDSHWEDHRSIKEGRRNSFSSCESLFVKV